MESGCLPSSPSAPAPQCIPTNQPTSKPDIDDDGGGGDDDDGGGGGDDDSDDGDDIDDGKHQQQVMSGQMRNWPRRRSKSSVAK